MALVLGGDERKVEARPIVRDEDEPPSSGDTNRPLPEAPTNHGPLVAPRDVLVSDPVHPRARGGDWNARADKLGEGVAAFEGGRSDAHDAVARRRES